MESPDHHELHHSISSTVAVAISEMLEMVSALRLVEVICHFCVLYASTLYILFFKDD